MFRPLSASAKRSTSLPAGKGRLQPAARNTAPANNKTMLPQALTRGAQATKRPDHKLPPVADRHPWRSRINNVNAYLRQNQWPDSRVNTGEDHRSLKPRFFKAQVFKNRCPRFWPLKQRMTAKRHADSDPGDACGFRVAALRAAASYLVAQLGNYLLRY